MLVWVVGGKLVEKDPDTVRKLQLVQRDAATKWVQDEKLVEEILTSPLYKLSQKEAGKLYERVVVNTRLLDKTLVESIREEWRIAWRGGYLPENPDKIPDTVFMLRE